MTDSFALVTEGAEIARAISYMVAAYPADEQMFQLETLAHLLAPQSGPHQLLLVEGKQAGQRTAVALAQVLPGRAAIIWPMRCSNERSGDLIRYLLQELRRRGVVLAQALLDMERSEEKKRFLSAGFQDAGEIAYMVAELAPGNVELPGSDCEFDVVEPDDPELARIIQETYRGSLDCPIIDGWRDVKDVVKGYASTGTFRAGLWRLLRWRGELAGCILLTDFPELSRGELMYLGILPQFRGKGLGLIATRWAGYVGLSQGWKHLILAVDRANEPARKIYQAVGFGDFLRRQVLVCRI